jgi:hypothetical protein
MRRHCLHMIAAITRVPRPAIDSINIRVISFESIGPLAPSLDLAIIFLLAAP